MRKTMKKILSFLPFIILGLTIMMIFQLGYALANGEVPAVFNRAISYVPTESMEDEIMAGDIIIIHTKFDSLEVGDVISFHAKIDRKKVNITHKIIEINGELITTQGVNNDSVAAWEMDISIDQVIGVYKGQRSAFFGAIYGSLFAKSFNIIFFIIILVFLIIIVLEIVNIAKAIHDKKLNDEKNLLIEEAKKELKQNEDDQ